jgi:hypothetical protein
MMVCHFNGDNDYMLKCTWQDDLILSNVLNSIDGNYQTEKLDGTCVYIAEFQGKIKQILSSYIVSE